MNNNTKLPWWLYLMVLSSSPEQSARPDNGTFSALHHHPFLTVPYTMTCPYACELKLNPKASFIFLIAISVISLAVVKAKSSLCHGHWHLQQWPVCRYASNIMLDVCAFMHVFELWLFVLHHSVSQNWWQAGRSMWASVLPLQAVKHIEQLHCYYCCWPSVFPENTDKDAQHKQTIQGQLLVWKETDPVAG